MVNFALEKSLKYINKRVIKYLSINQFGVGEAETVQLSNKVYTIESVLKRVSKVNVPIYRTWIAK